MLLLSLLLNVYVVSLFVWSLLLVYLLTKRPKQLSNIEKISYYISILVAPLCVFLLIPLIIFNFFKRFFILKKTVSGVQREIDEIIKNNP